MSPKRGYCHCCQREDVELHKKSHILPSFMFNNIYGQGGQRLILVDSSNWEELGSHPDSPYEKFIFCKCCEKDHSAIESKAAEILNHKKWSKLNVTTYNKGELKQNYFENINTDIIKHFWVLNLFRANISERNLFTQVSLGPYSEIFRQILLKELPLKKSNLSVHVFMLSHILKEGSKLSTGFYKNKIGNKNVYMIFIDGVGYILHFGTPDSKVLESTNFNANGRARVNIPNKRTGKLLLKMFSFEEEHINKL